MIKQKYRLFPQLFVKRIIKIIKTSKDREIARENMKRKLKLDDVEVDYILSYKLKKLIEFNLKDKFKYFIDRLIDIHYLSNSISCDEVIDILENKNIAFRKYEISDSDYFYKKGSIRDCSIVDLIILEITNPNHEKHIEIQIDKEMNCVVDLYFGSYWFEYYGCYTKQEFSDKYIETIKKIKNDEIKIVSYHSKKNNKWFGDRRFDKDNNPELDDTKEMEEYLAKLNKKKPGNNVVAYVYNWSEFSQIN